MKFIYKIIIKKLKEKFTYSKSLSIWDRNFDKEFYIHYFLDISEELNLPLETFYDPLNSKKSTTKTLNNAYLKMILKSQKFREDVEKYLSSGFIMKDYFHLIERKINQITQRFEQIGNCSDKEVLHILIQKMIKYFRTNR